METLKKLVSRLKLFCEFDIAVVEKLDELSKDVYALKEDNKLNKTGIQGNARRIGELTMAFGDVRKAYEHLKK